MLFNFFLGVCGLFKDGLILVLSLWSVFALPSIKYRNCKTGVFLVGGVEDLEDKVLPRRCEAVSGCG